ncbi:hypothetical protein BsWGS_11792 [Bradybaena similaris]
MSRPENRQSQLLKNAEHLHRLAAMETVLDEELDRLESEHDWCCRKYVYLQALEIDSAHLHHAAVHIQKSRDLIDMLRSLLEDTFEEKLLFMSEVRNQQLQWRMEDSHMSQQHHHYLQLPPTRNKFHSGSSSHFLVKRNKMFTMPVKKVKTQRSHSYLTSLTIQSQMSISLSKKCKESVKICSRSKSEIRKARHVLPKKYYSTKKHNISQMQISKSSELSKSHSVAKGQEVRVIHHEQNNVFSHITNEMTRYSQMIGDSPAILLPPITNQPIGMEDFRHDIRRHIWRCERSWSSDLCCMEADDETLHIGRMN